MGMRQEAPAFAPALGAWETGVPSGVGTRMGTAPEGSSVMLRLLLPVQGLDSSCCCYQGCTGHQMLDM